MTKSAWQGDLVWLRGVEPGDWEHFMAWERDGEANRLGWMVHLPRGSEWARKAALEQSAAASPDNDDHRFIITTLRGVAVGTINTHASDRVNRRFQYGISIAREHWGHGYASDALTVLFRHFFGEKGYHKVNAWVYAFNERSRRFHENFGMTLEGTRRETHFSNGEFHDEHLFGMTAGEFFARHGRPAGSEPGPD